MERKNRKHLIWRTDGISGWMEEIVWSILCSTKAKWCLLGTTGPKPTTGNAMSLVSCTRIDSTPLPPNPLIMSSTSTSCSCFLYYAAEIQVSSLHGRSHLCILLSFFSNPVLSLNISQSSDAKCFSQSSFVLAVSVRPTSTSRKIVLCAILIMAHCSV